METNLNNHAHSQRKGFTCGAILILAGLFLLLNQLGWLDVELYFLNGLGLAFIGAAFLTRKSGFLIPGGILTGLGTGVLLFGQYNFNPEMVQGGMFLLIFAGGWVLISLLSVVLNLLDRSQEVMVWPLIPAMIMAAIGGLVFAGQTGLNILAILKQAWPVALIIAGVYTIFRRR